MRFRPNTASRLPARYWLPVMWQFWPWSLLSWPFQVPTGFQRTSIPTKTLSVLVSLNNYSDLFVLINIYDMIRFVGLLFRPLQVCKCLLSTRLPSTHILFVSRHPPYQYDEIFHGCHWIYSSKYQNIRDWLQPGKYWSGEIQSLCGPIVFDN